MERPATGHRDGRARRLSRLSCWQAPAVRAPRDFQPRPQARSPASARMPPTAWAWAWGFGLWALGLGLDGGRHPQARLAGGLFHKQRMASSAAIEPAYDYIMTEFPPVATLDHLRADVAGKVGALRQWLSGLDVEHLTDRERVDLVAELERVKSTAAATQARATCALRKSREAAAPQDAVRSVGAEVALARRQSPTLGDRFVGLARALVDEMPCTMRALDAGDCSEQHALVMVQATSVLSLEHRTEVDRRVGPVLDRLGVRGAERAARRVAAELDAAAVVRRMEEAVRSRRVTVRPAPDGMGYLTVLGPLVEVVGAYASVRGHAAAVVTGQCPDELPEGRAVGAVAADRALRLLSGRDVGQQQPVEVHLVMTDRALLGTGDPQRSPMEPARIPGHGSIPAPVARASLKGEPAAGPATGVSGGGDGVRIGAKPDGGATASARPGAGAGEEGDDQAAVWVRRLYTSPDGRDLVAMDSRRRYFSGLLRRMLVLRDDVCSTPWCEAPIVHADHTTPARDEGRTSFASGTGKCARCNYGKEAPGWAAVVAEATSTGAGGRLQLRLTTPVGRHYTSESPPLLGWGSGTLDGSAQQGPGQPLPAAPAGPPRDPVPHQLAHPLASTRMPPAGRTGTQWTTAVPASIATPTRSRTPTPTPAPPATATSRDEEEAPVLDGPVDQPSGSSGPLAGSRRRRTDRARANALCRAGVTVHRSPDVTHLERTLWRYRTPRRTDPAGRTVAARPEQIPPNTKGFGRTKAPHPSTRRGPLTLDRTNPAHSSRQTATDPPRTRGCRPLVVSGRHPDAAEVSSRRGSARSPWPRRRSPRGPWRRSSWAPWRTAARAGRSP